MAVKRKRLIRKYCLSILFTSLFLFCSTYFIYLPKHSNMIGALSFLGKMQSLSFIEISKDLTLNYDFPVSDEMGKYASAYEFGVFNNSTDLITYQLTLFTGNDSQKIPQNSIHYIIQKNKNEYSEVRTLSEDGEIALEQVEAGQTDYYAIKFWVHTDVDPSILGKTFRGVINLTAVH